jgi:probable lipoprotein (TIGR04455 family)
MNLRSLCVVLLLTGTGCSVVKQSTTRSDWDSVDANKVKRLLVVTSPLPDGNEHVGQLWSKIARRYTNQKREFIAKEEVSVATLEAGPKSLCKEGIDGVLHLVPDVKKKGEGVEAAVKAQLVRCPDGEQDWSAEAAGSWDSNDKLLESTTKEYADDIGADVAPYVAPTFHLLKHTLDTLPNPVLTDADKDEKIENLD